MADIEALGIEVKGIESFQRARDEFGRFNKAAEEAGKTAEGFGPKVKKAGDEAVKSSSRAAKAGDDLRRTYDRLNGTLASVGRNMLAMGAATLGLAAVARTLSGFEHSMAAVLAITRANTQELAAMRDMAKQLGATTEFTAGQAADGLRFLGMAGFTAKESLAAIPAVLDLATAATMGLADAADIASNIMSGFGIAAKNAASVADVLAAASSRANTDVQQLGGAMSTVAPISAALGISLEDTAAAIGVMSDAGIQGERAGTAMRGALAALAGPTTEAQKTLKSLGLTIQDVNPETNSLATVFGRLRDAGISTADAMTIFGREAASGALVLVGAAERVGAFGDELRASAGEANRMASIMRDSLSGDFKNLESAVESVIIAMGDAGLTAILRGAVQFMTQAVLSVSGLIDTFGALVRFVSGALSPVLNVLGDVLLWVAKQADIVIVSLAAFYAPAIIGGITLLTKALAVGLVGALRAVAMALALNPLTAFVAAIAAAVTALTSFSDKSKEARQRALDLSGSIDDVTQSYLEMARAQREVMILDATKYLDDQRRAVRALYGELESMIVTAPAANAFSDPDGSRLAAYVELRDQIDEIRTGNLTAAEATDQLSAAIGNAAKSGLIAGPVMEELKRKAGELAGAASEAAKAAEMLVILENLLTAPVGAPAKPSGGGAPRTTPTTGDVDRFDKWLKQQVEAVRNASELTRAYLLGGDAISQATRQQEINNLVLEHGEKARGRITIAVNEYGKAMDRLDVASQINDQKRTNEQLLGHIRVLQAQSRGLKEGTEALEEYNRQLALSEILAGKTAEEVSDLVAVFEKEWAEGSALQREADALEEINGLIDATQTKQEKYQAQMERLVSLRPYAKTAEQVMALDRAIQQLERDNNEWLTFTEQAIERIDQSFADMWQNVVDGTATSFDAMKQGFKRMLAEMAHAAITRPIMISVGNALMGTNNPGGVGQGGGMFGGGGFPGGIFSGIGQALTGASVGASAVSLGAANVAGALGGDAIGTLIAMNGGWAGVGGGAAAGALGAAGTVMSAIGAAAPYIGIGLMAYSMLKDAFDGETRFGAGYTIGADTGFSAVRTGGPSGGDQSAQQTMAAIEETFKSTERLANLLGGSLSGLQLGAGLEISPEKGRSFVWSDWAGSEGVSHQRGMVDLSGVTDGGVVGQEFSVELGRALIRGLQRSNVEDHWREWVEQINVDALDETGVQGVLATIEALVQLRDMAINMGMESLANASAKAQANIIQLSGGIDGFTTNLAAYYQAFYSEAERTANLQATLTKTMQDLGYELPATHAAFRALVEAQDLTTESGQQAYASLIGISGAFDQLVTSLDGLGGAVSDVFGAQLEVVRTLAAETNRLLGARNRAGTVLGQIDRAMGRADGFSAQREAELWAAMATASYEQQIDLAQELTNIVMERYQNEIASAEQLRDIGRSLREYVQSLTIGELSPLTLGEKLAEASADYATTLAMAQAGDTGAMGRLQGAADAYLRLARDYYASSDEYTRIFDYVTGSLDTLGIQAMSDAERQLGVSEETLNELTELRNVAQRAFNALDSQYQSSLSLLQTETAILADIGVDTGRLHDIAGLLAALPAELAGRLQGILTGAAGGVVGGWYADAGFSDPAGQDYWADQLQNKPQDTVRRDFLQAMVEGWYRDNLGWNPDQEAINYWSKAIAEVGAQQAFGDFARTAGLPGYANGGFASGMAIVGERGPEIVDFTNSPGRVYTNSQLSSAMSMGQGAGEEVRMLRKELAEQSKMLAAVIAQSSQANAERVSGSVENTASRSTWDNEQRRYATTS